jgi:hypothetical protein
MVAAEIADAHNGYASFLSIHHALVLPARNPRH